MNELFTFLSIVLVPASASIFLYLYKSKCQNVKLFWGCLSVQRDVRGEEKYDLDNRNNTNTTLELSAVI
jgi:hypothetical protein